MNLFLDDIRPTPTGYEAVDNYKDCIFLLGTREYERVSLDYSLGSKWTGLDVLKWMAENQRFPKELNIHSTHPYGRSAMAAYIREHFPSGYVFTMEAR
ncbi:MAG: cell division protein FtsJ [Oscillospiraceae bacterium]|jgi:hypothetical protein|nr:cell division protein FtsJ [Oscillospiraceae bacterium]